MPIKDYNTTPANNTAINGINIAEGCAPSNINNAIRQLMADLADKEGLRSFLSVVIGKDVQAYNPKLYNMVVPIGGTIEWNGLKEPEGWMFEDGRALSRTTYAALFEVIGTQFGKGNGSSTFNIPDSRGRVVAGLNQGAARLTAKAGGVDGDVLGAVGGAEQHVLSIEQLPAHNHTGNTNKSGAHTHTTSVDSAGVGGGDHPDTPRWNALASRNYGKLSATTSLSGEHVHGFTTDNRGGGQAHNNVQPTIIKNKIIRVL